MEWNLIFDRKGTLVKATHFPAACIRARPNPVRVLNIEDVDPPHEKP